MLTVIKCFTILVASGNGNKCCELRSRIRDQLSTIDRETGWTKVMIHKFGQETYPGAYKRVCEEVAKSIRPIISNIDERYICSDNGKKQCSVN